jgi:glycine/D-amino acid oxidase-like deaminating enzyme
MQTFDWIVVGNGLTGAAASYELARQGHSVTADRPDPYSLP